MKKNKFKIIVSFMVLAIGVFGVMLFQKNNTSTTVERDVASYEFCDQFSKVRDYCKLKLVDIRPTQFAVGKISVEYKAKKLNKMSGDDLKKYLQTHPAPVVIGPGNQLYIVDHHHLATALMISKQEKKHIYANIIDDLRHMPPMKFWKLMYDKKLVYLFDENGRGPLNPALLPLTIAELKDDPFRSLAWAVREEEGFDKVDVPFAEFAWADFFRKKMGRDYVSKHFDDALKAAMKLARSNEASNLPGFKR